jgi:hypothetical protein
MKLKKPYLIQRCKLNPEQEKLIYDYMGMAEFEVGNQSVSLRHIFKKGVVTQTCSVEVEGNAVTVFLLASEGFSFDEYHPHLQVLANESYHQPEPTHMNHTIKSQLGILGDRFTPSEFPDVWFDFENHILWTLDEDRLNLLVDALESIQAQWGIEKEPEPFSLWRWICSFLPRSTPTLSSL